jgi:hypothetical protein
MAVIHEVPNISRCMRIYDDKGEFTVSLFYHEQKSS